MIIALPCHLHVLDKGQYGTDIAANGESNTLWVGPLPRSAASVQLSEARCRMLPVIDLEHMHAVAMPANYAARRARKQRGVSRQLSVGNQLLHHEN